MSVTVTSPHRRGKAGWVRVSPKSPCPICGKSDNCSVSSDGGAVWCGRVDVGAERQNAGGQWLHRLSDSRPASASVLRIETKRTPCSETQPKDFSFVTLRQAAPSAAIFQAKLAAQLGVSAASLAALGVYQHSPGVAGIPEMNADGDIIGVACRDIATGDKWQVGGGRRGLVFSWDNLDLDGPLHIVEGASDAAAGIDLGLRVIARPNNLQAADASLLAALSRTDEIIVVGERDQKPDGRWPGRDGALAVAKRLARELPHIIRIQVVLPPPGHKDLRAFHLAGGTKEAWLAGCETVEWSRPRSKCGPHTEETHPGSCECGRCQSEGHDDQPEYASCSFSAFGRSKRDGNVSYWRLACDRWACPTCRTRRLIPRWAAHVTQLWGQDAVYMRVVHEHEWRGVYREIGRGDGDYIRIAIPLSETIGATVYKVYSSVPFRNAEELTGDKARAAATNDIGRITASRRAVSTSRGWALPTRGESDWEILHAGRRYDRAAAMQAAREYKVATQDWRPATHRAGAGVLDGVMFSTADWDDTKVISLIERVYQITDERARVPVANYPIRQNPVKSNSPPEPHPPLQLPTVARQRTLLMTS